MLSVLEAKLKDGFVTGNLPKPPLNSPRFAGWKQANSLVCSWIKSSMSPDIANTFAFINDERTLWSDIAEQYGTTNLPQLFEIKREIALVRQGDSSVAAYYGCLKQLWDQYTQLRPIPIIDNEIEELMITREAEDKRMEFLMDLNEEERFKLTGIPKWYHENKKLQQLQPARMNKMTAGMNNVVAGMNNVSNMVTVGETPLNITSDNNGDLQMVISGAVQKGLREF
ncbi:OLC1v1004974C1 [Oldenlandia corymbosa var. corymbosa]|uniref:OLC1v1004974C1 n=1 Tax=Oldenlandia corymbosa var. corymbosa TaxID=529605 RepID=A0AAV1DDI6_OLDCO|nr:OLC1v1004974C1 [Oldenlandia corymbosa var. corymbosa]